MTTLQRRQKENQQNRMLLVDSNLLHPNGGIAQTAASRLMLEGESIPIQPLPALPACTQHAFFSTVISGGTILLRADAMCRVCEDAYEKNLPSLILHCENRSLEAAVFHSSLIEHKAIINGTNGQYDPFFNLSPVEISDLFMRSIPERYQQNMNFGILVGLTAELYWIRKKRSIPLRTLLRFHIADLPQKILDTQQRGLINQRETLELNRRYQAAQSAVAALQYYLDSLRSQFQPFYAAPANPSDLLFHTLQASGVVTIDIMDIQNEFFIRMLVNHIRLLHRQGFSFVAGFSDLELAAYGGDMLAYAAQGDHAFIASAPDIVSAVGEPSQLSRLLSEAENSIYFGHRDGAHCAVLSDSLGTYKRWKINYSYGRGNSGIIPNDRTNVSLGEDMSAKRVPADLLQALQGREMIFRDGVNNRIYLMNLC